ncbi:MAG: penicillin-binding protein 2 [Anaerolineales bacterium]|nr:penicillin-binding protein 2 [Anaerolineales bacterium]
MTNEKQTETRSTVAPWRINFFLIAAGVVFIVFIVRLFTIQIVQSAEYIAQAEENRTETISISTRRGVIYDRNGIILARNIASYNVAITPALLPYEDSDPDVIFKDGEANEIFRELSYLTGVPVYKGSIEDPLLTCGDNMGIREMAAKGFTFSPYTPVLIKCDIDIELAMAIQEKAVDWPGVSIEVEPIRDYPTGEVTAGVVGFLGPIPALREEELRAEGFIPNRDKVGYAGIELYFDEELRGKNGQRVVEVDVAGQTLRDIEAPLAAEPGLNLILTLDTRLQQAAYSILRREIDFWNTYLGRINATSGVVIAMNPQTGEILSMVYWPTFENNRMARFIPAYYYEQLTSDSTEPLLNHAVGAEMPAGSVFKLVTAVGALNEEVVTPDTVLDTPGTIELTEKFYAGDPGSGREFVDWNRAGFGSLNFLGGISNSSNVYFYKVGGGYRDEVPQGLGICRLGTYARALGYGDYLGIELPDEQDGLIPNPTWKRINQGENWSTGDTYLASVGQGLMIATPLQVLTSAATIANDGVLMQPTLLREIIDGEGNVIQAFEPQVKWDLTNPETPLIQKYDNPDGIGSCKETVDEAGNPVLTYVEPWVFDTVQQGMRQAVISGTLSNEFANVGVAAAGKTGTAEYCDDIANAKNLCIPGNWPTHAWTVAYAPYEDPEIAVVAFVYNGGEGASVAGPIVRQMIEAYFELKSIDAETGAP